jgi:hypothetical protein
MRVPDPVLGQGEARAQTAPAGELSSRNPTPFPPETPKPASALLHPAWAFTDRAPPVVLAGRDPNGLEYNFKVVVRPIKYGGAVLLPIHRRGGGSARLK